MLTSFFKRKNSNIKNFLVEKDPFKKGFVIVWNKSKTVGTSDILESSITNKGLYDENLIRTAIKKYEQAYEKKRENIIKEEMKIAETSIKAGFCNGLTAECLKCHYLWTIRKREGVPTSCPKCNKKKIEVLPY